MAIPLLHRLPHYLCSTSFPLPYQRWQTGVLVLIQEEFSESQQSLDISIGGEFYIYLTGTFLGSQPEWTA